MFEKKFKVKDLYIARLGRIEKQTVSAKRFVYAHLPYKIIYDGQICIFEIKNGKAVRITTGVEYPIYDNNPPNSTKEWFVKNYNPLSYYVKTEKDINSLTISENQILVIENTLQKRKNEKSNENEK